MTDPELASLITFGLTVNLAGAVVSFYLWREHKGERYLIFWTCAWMSSSCRWLLRGLLSVSPVAIALESGFICATLFFMVVGSYNLLPHGRWRRPAILVITGIVIAAYDVYANLAREPIVMGYALFVVVLLQCGVAMLIAHRSERLPGYAFAAAAFLAECLIVGIGLFRIGDGVSNSIYVPLFNIPLTLSVVLIAYQRSRRELTASQRTLQTIFDTAPVAIAIIRPPRGEVERANSAALEMLAVGPPSALGRASLEHSLITEPGQGEALYAELRSRGRISGRELATKSAGQEQRHIIVNGATVDLAGGERYIFAFHDITALRQAEQELRAHAEEMERLYVRLGTVEEDERRALHRELHDRAGANLSALSLELDLVARLLQRGDTEAAASHVTSAHEVTRETMAVARDMMAELRPPALDDYGLLAALRNLAIVTATRSGLSIDVNGPDLESRLNPFVETALFRIAQQALNNVTRHAQAKQVRVGLREIGELVRLEIIDDGIGFDRGIAREGGRWGLTTMQERARAIGGSLTVDSRPGAGTRITVELAVGSP